MNMLLSSIKASGSSYRVKTQRLDEMRKEDDEDKYIAINTYIENRRIRLDKYTLRCVQH